MSSGHPNRFLPGVASIEHWLHSQIEKGRHYNTRDFIIPFVAVVVLFFIFEPQQSLNNFQLVVFLSPIWLPVLLYVSAHDRFAQMTKMEFFAKQEYVLLEVLIPRDTTKTPFAMETFFANMHIGSGETTWWKRFVQGGTRPWWSFEIVSLGGRVHFYIWTRVGYRRLVESFLYAQYPDVEIIEAEDYSRLVDPSHHGWGMFAGEYAMGKAAPFPIKTYVDYKIEPGNKPEETVDPLAQIIETIAGIGPKEQFWIQIIIRQSKTEKYGNKKNAKGAPYTWSDEVKETLETLRQETVRILVRKDPVTGEEIKTESFPNPSKGVSENIASVERKANKQVFDVGIRTLYLAPDDAFQGIMIPAQINMFKPFNTLNANSINLTGVWSGAFNDWPWEDRDGHHKEHAHHQAVQMYRRRAYFHDPYKGTWMNLSTEELATLYHIPSSAITTPGLSRIQSSTQGAPSNLPT